MGGTGVGYFFNARIISNCVYFNTREFMYLKIPNNKYTNPRD